MQTALRQRYAHMAPTARRREGFRFFYYSGDRTERPHVHVRYGGGEAKFWIDTAEKVWNHGMKKSEVRYAQKCVKEDREELLAGWHRNFSP